jgi:TolB-like protein
VSELFAAARELPADERETFLRRGCGADDALRQEVEALLAADPDAERFFHSLVADGIPAALAALDEPPDGTRVGRVYGPYEVVEEIGRGGMGVVYRAEDRRLRRSVALKFLPGLALADPEARVRLMDEARAASTLDDPNICTIFELDETPEGEIYFAMAYYAGETLAQRLARGPVPLGEGLLLAVGIARGLAAAHARGIVHRDLTPRNVMLRLRHTVKILDFGLASAVGQHPGTVAGTPAYMPPEQILGTPAGPAGDVWSLGATLYELFTGQRAFTGQDAGTTFEAVLGTAPTPPRKLNPKIPEPLERLILRMLEKDPGARPPDAAAVLTALEPIVERHRSWRTRLVVTGTVSVLGLAVVALASTRGPAAPPRNVPAARVVFLPITRDSSRPDAVYLAAGLHEAVSSELSRIPGIALIGWTGGQQAEDGPRTRRRLGSALGAVAVLQGRVIGDDSVDLRLHDARNDREIWSSHLNFSRQATDGIGRGLAVEIAAALVVRRHDGMQGHLATITSDEEDRFVWTNLRQAVAGGYWLGGFRGFRGRTALEGWYWVTGEPFEYTNWLGRGPNDYFGEDGLQYWPSADSARWNDIDRISGFEPFVHGFLVEYTP